MTNGKLELSPQQLAIVFVLWLVAVFVCFAALASYSYKVGEAGTPSRLDRTVFPVPLPIGQHLLVMGVHPHCPCSRASLGELERLNARCQGQMHCVVLTYQPRLAEPSWSDTDISEFAKKLPNTQILIDLDGQLAERLGIRTSGGVVLYSPQDEPEFHGGITASRGHQGDNVGSASIVAWVHGQPLHYKSAPVFGCSLQTKLSERDQTATEQAEGVFVQ